MKFGGTSVGSLERMDRVASLVLGVDGPKAVVVSAMGGTTDALLQAAQKAESGDWEGTLEGLEAIAARHRAVAGSGDEAVAIDGLLAELREILHGVNLLRETTTRTRALLVSFGERMSAPLVSAAIRRQGQASFAVDARELVRTDDQHDEAAVDFAVTRTATQKGILPRIQAGEIPVITGFIGSTAAGVTTTLGRGGSDYSAALFGACLDASEVWIWTDVDGILTADPRLVAEARSLRQVSYREAAEMSYFGAKVLHPRTLLPCSQAGIPIRIRSTFDPDAEGTLVAETSEPVPEGVKTVTSIQDMALVTLEGRGMAGIPGVARRIFETTEAAGTNVVMISQASSEQTVSLVVRAADAAALVAELQVRFRLELDERALETIQTTQDVAIVSIIGEGMAGHVGVSGKLFGALGQAGVNVLAIAQGGSERSISVAVDGASVRRAVREVHSAFGLTRVAHIFLVGCGRVGQELLTMVAETRARLADQDLELRLIGLCNRRTWALELNGIDPIKAQDALANGGVRPDDAALIARIAQERLTDVVLVDVTAGPTAPLHQLALDAGFHVVTANKIPLAGPFEEYQRLVQARDLSRVRYGYETTFGAGLPVLHTLKELVLTGDELHAITGCFSGTLGFLCSKLQDGVSLADAVREAAALGYTEPDPREDLSGRDVARKALIVARAMGRALEPDDVVLTAMVPDLDEGLAVALAKHGPALGDRVKAAAARNEVLRFVAEITKEAVVVGLQEVPANSAIGALNGPDNILVFRTRRYNTYPLVIQGPGAGAEVTAAGVLGDILKTARGL